MSAGTHSSSHHFLDDFPQGASLYVLCDEVESLVLVEDSDELEHVRVIQAAHDLHLMRQRQIFLHTECCSRILTVLIQQKVLGLGKIKLKG